MYVCAVFTRKYSTQLQSCSHLHVKFKKQTHAVESRLVTQQCSEQIWTPGVEAALHFQPTTPPGRRGNHILQGNLARCIRHDVRQCIPRAGQQLHQGTQHGTYHSNMQHSKYPRALHNKCLAWYITQGTVGSPVSSHAKQSRRTVIRTAANSIVQQSELM